MSVVVAVVMSGTEPDSPPPDQVMSQVTTARSWNLPSGLASDADGTV